MYDIGHNSYGHWSHVAYDFQSIGSNHCNTSGIFFATGEIVLKTTLTLQLKSLVCFIGWSIILK